MGIIDFFVEREEKPDEKKEVISTPVTIAQPTIIPSVAPVATADTEKFASHFDSLFDQANLPGPDYYEFSKMVAAINAPGMAEDTKMTAAFTGLGIQGLTKQKLLDSANQYIAIIDEDSRKFEDALKNKIDTELEARKKKASSIAEKIKQTEELIKKMQDEMQQDRLQIDVINKEVAEQEAAISSKVTGYRTASEARKQMIAADIQKINTYLK